MTGPEQPSGASLETLRALGDWKRQNGQAAGAYFHPGREARILRTLAARHGGPLPVTAVLALWRTLVSAYLRLQWPFQVVVADDAATRDLARQHFGAATPVATAADPLAALAATEETLAVMPDVADGSGWWCAAPFLSRTGPRIVARLPFFGEGNGPAAYVVARHGADASGDDVTLAVRLRRRGWNFRCWRRIKRPAVGPAIWWPSMVICPRTQPFCKRFGRQAKFTSLADMRGRSPFRAPRS
jgi:hypothetical protein